MTNISYKIILLIPALVFSLTAQENKVRISDLEANEVQFAGFTLNSAKEVHIIACGSGGEREVRRTKNYHVDPQNMFAYAWIIDARTRELVWRMTIGNTEADWWNKRKKVFDANLRLEKGKYEIYFSTIKPIFRDGILTPGDIFDAIFGDDEWEEQAADWKVEVDGVDEVFQKSAVLKYQHAVKKSAVVNLTGMEDSENRKFGFSLSQEVTLRIRCSGEGDKTQMHDYGYIVDANTREKIWEMRRRETEHAGGALKNRITEEDVRFPAGDYIAYYKSDGSHSHEEWNANPPYDPEFWGLYVSAADRNFDRSIVSTFSEGEGTVILRMDRLGDYEETSEGFTLLKPMKLRIYALGEGRDGKMFDYGWIEDVRTGRRVWEMEYDDTDEAGGASKNRRYDGVRLFEPGSYVAHFLTDDSHSYRDWNSSKPDDPSSWGLKIYTIGKKGDEGFVKEYNPERDKSILVQLIRVGDDEHVRKQFTIKADMDVRIYAIGEGDWDEMYDYGWIEDFRTGRIVWEMEYGDTRRAGGASKNRLFDGTIRLRAGTYVAHYVADDSHAYGSWNSSAPRDKANWGITIYTFNAR